MATYELDDEVVRAWLEGHPDGNLASSLREQLAVPAPSKVGAIVRATYAGSVFVRWAVEELTTSCWIDVQDGEFVSTERLGRITEVLAPGVDL